MTCKKGLSRLNGDLRPFDLKTHEGAIGGTKCSANYSFSEFSIGRRTICHNFHKNFYPCTI